MNDRVGPQLADEGVASKGEVGGVDGQALTIHPPGGERRAGSVGGGNHWLPRPPGHLS